MAVQRPSEDRLSDSEGVARELDELEGALAELRARFEQYFLGVDRQPPTKDHDSVRARLGKLRNAFVRSAALKFRIQGLQQRFTTYDRLWHRTLTEMENGTYSRDLFKARRRRKTGDVPTVGPPPPVAQAPAPAEKAAPAAVVPPAPVPTGTQSGAPAPRPGPVPSIAPVAIPAGTQGGATRPPGIPAGTQGGAVRAKPVGVPTGTQGAVSRAAAAALAEPRLRAVYDAFVAAKKRCKEDVSRLSFESVADSLRKQVPELLERHGAKDVEYKVVVKDGKAVLRAVPKE
jgi:hypothetical protein